jgi:putative ABC transport system substrate-binding protein
MRRALLAAALAVLALGVNQSPAAEMKKVAIASFGPHASLQQVIDGFKQALADKGFVDGARPSATSTATATSTLARSPGAVKLEATKPDLMLTVTTPMTQAAVKLVRDQSLPIVFAPVTDPVAAGLVPDWQHGSARFVGASNMQSTETVIDFARKLLGDVKSFGMLYNPGDANDVTGKNLAEAAAKAKNVEFRAVSVDSVNDIAVRTNALQVSISSMRSPESVDAGAAGDRFERRADGHSGDQFVSARRAGRRGPCRDVGLLEQGRLQCRTAGGANSQWRQVDGACELQADPGRSYAGDQRETLKAAGKTLPPALADCNCVID